MKQQIKKTKKEYQGYFRKGWILHTFILCSIFFSGLGLLGLVTTIKGIEGVILGTSGIMALGLGGGLMDVILCYEYHQTGEDRL